jgi:hypothetical protein
MSDERTGPAGAADTAKADAPTLCPGEAPSTPTAESEAAPADMLRSFGDYELLGELGRGGMGVVYQARDRHSGHLIALKMMLEQEAPGTTELRRFILEARAAGELNHSGIVAIHSCGEHDGHSFYTMDFVSGVPLQRILEKGPLSGDRAVRYLIGIARAVAAAHAVGIVHRDLKPSNVIIDHHDQPRILDFGLAKRQRKPIGGPSATQSIAMVLPADASVAQPTVAPADTSRTSRVTQEGTILGTPSYMSPEQARGEHSRVGPPADVHALGILLYEMLVGRPPFQGGDVMATLVQVMEREAPPMWVEGRRVPAVLQAVCRRCLQKDPQARYPDAGALADDLETSWEQARERRRCARLVLAGGLSAALLIGLRVALAGWLVGLDDRFGGWAAAGGWGTTTAAAALVWLLDGVIFLGAPLVALLTAAVALVGWARRFANTAGRARAEVPSVKTEPFLQRLFVAAGDKQVKRHGSGPAPGGLADFEVLKWVADWPGGHLHRGRQRSLDRPVLVWQETTAAGGPAKLPVATASGEKGAVRPGVFVRHPYVLGLHIAVSTPQGRFLVTEPAAASHLAGMLEREVPQPRDAIVLAARIARALQAFHDQGSCHGRLSPDWILVRGDMEPLLCPCGIPSTSAEERTRDCVDLGLMLQGWLPRRSWLGRWQPFAAVYRVCAAAGRGNYARPDDLADDLERALRQAVIRSRERWASLFIAFLIALPPLLLFGRGLLRRAEMGSAPAEGSSADQLVLIPVAAAAVLGYFHARAFVFRYRLRLHHAGHRLALGESAVFGLLAFALLTLEAVLFAAPGGGLPAAALVPGYWLVGALVAALVSGGQALLGQRPSPENPNSPAAG